MLITEIRAGRREGSIISVQTIDTVARNNQESWDVLRRELEDIGISPAIISEKRQYIIAWFQEAVAAGKLEEDTPSDDGPLLFISHGSNSANNDSDITGVSSKEVSIAKVSQRKSASITGISSTTATGSINDREANCKSFL